MIKLALNSVVPECWLQLFQSHLRGSSFPERKNSFIVVISKISTILRTAFIHPIQSFDFQNHGYEP
jgi:hypothetical protein